MAIPDYLSRNFDTLLRVATAGDLALMECSDAVTGEPRYVLCAVGRDAGDFVMAPFGLNRAGFAGGSNSSHEGLGVKGLPRAFILSRTASKV